MKKKSWFIIFTVCFLIISGCQKSNTKKTSESKEAAEVAMKTVIGKKDTLESKKVNGETVTVFLPEKWQRLSSEEVAGEIRLGTNEKQEPAGVTLQAYPKKSTTIVDVWNIYAELNTIGGISEDLLINGLLTQRTSSEDFTSLYEKSLQKMGAIMQIMETENNYILMVARTNEPTEENNKELLKIADSVAVNNQRPANELSPSKTAQESKVEDLGEDIQNLEIPIRNASEKIETKEDSDEIEEMLKQMNSDEENEKVSAVYDREKMLTTVHVVNDSTNELVTNSIKPDGFIENYAEWKISRGWNNRMMVIKQDISYDAKGHSLMVLNPYNKNKALLLVDADGVRYDFMDEIIAEK